MEVRTGSLSFPRARDIGPRTDRVSFNFTNPVRQAVAGLTGSSFGFSPSDDHHLGLVNIRLSTTVDDDVVTVEGTFGVRDWSGEYDDDYEGNIQFVLLVELETGFVPSNLSITGVEYNQTIQFFRSKLDPATARPDNSIGLIAGKNTILRVYVDTQNDPARPTIALVSGVLETRSSGSANWVPAMLLNTGPIPPKRDALISRGNANDTLNFFIPGASSTGNLDYRVRVFDSAHTDQPGYTSGRIQGALQFTPVSPLSVHGVGINYTGKGGPIAAPDMAALRSNLSFVLKNYPVGEISITGFDVIDYDGDFTDQSGDGCGSGWGGLLDKLREMQGDSKDVYFGLVPAGLPSVYGGCGGGDGRVAAGPVNSGRTAAQEIAHAFGRDHAPCPPPGQPNSPGNVDTSYPVYDALRSGSIGEFGIDDLGAVKDPAIVADFMSYCGPAWVSPYTYQGLSENFPSVPVSPARAFSIKAESFIEEPSEVLSVPRQNLFLNFRLYYGGQVEVSPSFHFLSRPVIKTGRWTPYVIELRDCHDKPLNSQRVLLTDPHKDLDSAALDFYKPIPFHKETARVVFTCEASGDCKRKEIFSVNVPSDTPQIRFLSPQKCHQLTGKVRISWEAHSDNKCLYYLLRYSNDEGQSWRALAPRMRATEHIVDFDNLPGGERCQLQVLATEGIRTGMAVSELFGVPRRPPITIIAGPPDGTVIVPGQLVTLIGESYSANTGSAHPSELQWYSDLDGLIGAGHEIHISTLRPSVHQISLRAPDYCGGESTASVQIEVKKPVSHKHTSLTHPDHTSKEHDSGKVPGK